MDKAFWSEKLKNVPTRPGVYLFRDEQNVIIYVGKAENLKNRVSSYFRSEQTLAPKTLAMRERARSLETIVVDSPAEALLLECNLIKLHKPHYNILLKDSKTYPYLKVTLGEKWPRLLVTRRLTDDGSRYFGPYTNVTAMNETVALCRRLFPLRNCGAKPGRTKGRACLNYDIGQCCAPCVQKISPEDYRNIANKLVDFLSGDGNELKAELNRQMLAASERLDFETAALCRDRLRAVETTLEHQKITAADCRDDRDFIALSRDGDEGAVTVFFIRGGKLLGRETVTVDRCGDLDDSALYQLFITDFYRGDRLIPPEIVLAALPAESEVLRQLFHAKRGGRFAFTVPQRGEKARLLSLAAQNGDLLLAEARRNKQNNSADLAEAQEQLRVALALTVTPRRIECYDISHIQGAYTVGSMIVFMDGRAKNSEYRRFRIKTVAGIDDFASLAEVLERRLKRGLREKGEGKTEGFAHLPDLVIIDGGRGQLNAVLPLRDQYVPDIPFVSLAEREEELMLPNVAAPLCLPVGSPAYHLIQRIRDEAHRFAITYHRQLRTRGQTKSELDDIPTIGPARRQALLKHFGSVKAIADAGEDELALVETMNRDAAAAVYTYFRLKRSDSPGE